MQLGIDLGTTFAMPRPLDHRGRLRLPDLFPAPPLPSVVTYDPDRGWMVGLPGGDSRSEPGSLVVCVRRGLGDWGGDEASETRS